MIGLLLVFHIALQTFRNSNNGEKSEPFANLPAARIVFNFLICIYPGEGVACEFSFNQDHFPGCRKFTGSDLTKINSAR